MTCDCDRSPSLQIFEQNETNIETVFKSRRITENRGIKPVLMQQTVVDVVLVVDDVRNSIGLCRCEQRCIVW